MASVSNAHTSSTQAAPAAVTAPTLSSNQGTPTSPVKKVSRHSGVKHTCVLLKCHLYSLNKIVLNVYSCCQNIPYFSALNLELPLSHGIVTFFCLLQLIVIWYYNE